MELYFTSLGILLLGAFSSIFVKEHWKFKTCSAFLFVSMLLMLVPSLESIFTGRIFEYNIYLSQILGNVNFVIDPLAAFFIVVISVMSFMASIYANGYLKQYYNKQMNLSSHSFFFILLILSMLLVVTSHNALFFLIVWEIMSLSSFFLVIFEGEKKEVLSA